MKSRLLTAMAFFMGMLASCVGDEPAKSFVLPGDELPYFCVEAYYGSDFNSPVTVTSESLKGRPAVVVLFNTSCSDCQAELPVVQRLYDCYGDDAGFLCVSRNQSKQSVADYWNTQGITLPVAPQDGTDVYNLFATSIIPRTYICDASGIVVAAFDDNPVPDYETLEARLVEVIQISKSSEAVAR